MKKLIDKSYGSNKNTVVEKHKHSGENYGR